MRGLGPRVDVCGSRVGLAPYVLSFCLGPLQRGRAIHDETVVCPCRAAQRGSARMGLNRRIGAANQPTNEPTECPVWDAGPCFVLTVASLSLRHGWGPTL